MIVDDSGILVDLLSNGVSPSNRWMDFRDFTTWAKKWGFYMIFTRNHGDFTSQTGGCHSQTWGFYRQKWWFHPLKTGSSPAKVAISPATLEREGKRKQLEYRSNDGLHVVVNVWDWAVSRIIFDGFWKGFHRFTVQLYKSCRSNSQAMVDRWFFAYHLNKWVISPGLLQVTMVHGGNPAIIQPVEGHDRGFSKPHHGWCLWGKSQNKQTYQACGISRYTLSPMGSCWVWLPHMWIWLPNMWIWPISPMKLWTILILAPKKWEIWNLILNQPVFWRT